MSDRESEFPPRMRGIWRSGALRPSDFHPETPELPPVKKQSLRRSQAQAAREARQQSASAQEASSDRALKALFGGAAPSLGGIKGRLSDLAAEARSRRVSMTKAGEEARNASEAAQAAAGEQSTSGSTRKRGAGIGALVPMVVVFAIIAGFLNTMPGIDIEREAGRLLASGERWLARLLEPERSVPRELGAGAPPAAQPAAATAPSPVYSSSLVRNGSFELPPLGGMQDQRVPDDWRFEGNRPYFRRASAAAGYPPAADGAAVMTLEGERHGILYQDLGPMQSGVTYSFRAHISNATGRNSYRAALWRIDGQRHTELAWTSERKVAVPAQGSFPVEFSYTATDEDGGKLLRLQLSDNASGEATRAAIDDVVVRALR